MNYQKFLCFFITVFILLLPVKTEAYEKAVVDITKMSISDLQDSLEKGYLTSEQLVQLYIDRINEYNDEFNAINQINENALEEAKELDKERAEGNVRSSLHGIPILVKTNIDVSGLATTAGAKSLSDNYPLEDATVIKKLKEAGAIILGSTNMSEFAFSASNSYSSYGYVKNAFNTSYSPYGSSGGSAVSIATSFAAAALGTDTNSSVRIPASAAGLVGIRPTYGLISTDGVIPYDTERDTVGVLTKTVNDNALILSIIAEKDNDLEYFKDYNLSDIKIGVITSYLDGSSSSTGANSKTDTDIANLAKEKIELLEEAGANIVYIDELLNSNYLSIASSTMSGITFCDGFNTYIKNTTGTIRSFSSLASSSSHVYSLSGYLSGCDGTWKSSMTAKNSKKSTFETHVLEVMEENDVDILVYPTLKNKNLKLTETGINAPGSSLGSVIGYPSITVPMGYIDEFAYGLEFFSIKNSEDLLYSVARVFESVNDLDIVNSPLTPSLYEIPDYIDDLKEYYESHYLDSNYDTINEETKTYFLNYTDMDDEEGENNATLLIKKYQTLENKIRSKKKIRKIYIPLGFIIVLIALGLFKRKK